MKLVDIRQSIRKHPTKRPGKRELSDIKYIVIHHSLTKTGSAEAYANYHIGNNDWSVMGYTYVIEQNGDIKWCADHTTITPHVGKHNRESIGICLTGDFRTQKPTKAQQESLMILAGHLTKVLPQAQIKGHSELEGYIWKECPVIDMNKVRREIDDFLNEAKRIEVKETEVFADGKSYKAYIHEGVTYAPVRQLAESLGKRVHWDGKNVHIK
jgi:hypothetical protein